MINKVEKKSIPLDEQETNITIVPTLVSKTAEVYTCIRNFEKKLHDMAEQYPEYVKIVKEDAYGTQATVPAAWVTVRKPRTIKMTDEQKKELAERLLQARQAKTAP